MFFLTANCFAQKNDAPKNSQLSKYYNLAINDFLHEVTSVYQLHFDSLLVGQHEEFPPVTLDSKINNTLILLLGPEKGETIMKKNTKAFYVNIISWGTTNDYQFKLFVFSKGYAHEFDWRATYQFDSNNQGKKLSSQFENFGLGR